MFKKIQEDKATAKEETIFEVEKINDKNIIITSTNKHGTMKTSLFLWPKEIFEYPSR